MTTPRPTTTPPRRRMTTARRPESLAGTRGKISFLPAWCAQTRRRKKVYVTHTHTHTPHSCGRQCPKNLSLCRHSFRRRHRHRHRRHRGPRRSQFFPKPFAATRRLMRRSPLRDRHRRTRPSLIRGRDARDRRGRPSIRLFARLRLSNRCATTTPWSAPLPPPPPTLTPIFAFPLSHACVPLSL